MERASIETVTKCVLGEHVKYFTFENVKKLE